MFVEKTKKIEHYLAVLDTKQPQVTGECNQPFIIHWCIYIYIDVLIFVLLMFYIYPLYIYIYIYIYIYV